MATGSFIDNPLKNEIRKNIYDFLKEHKKSNLYQIKKGTGIKNYESVRYHLNVLIKKRLVASPNGIDYYNKL
jgi:predicted transcriptional regulator